MTRINIAAALIVVCFSTLHILEGIPLDPECEITKGCFYHCDDADFCEFVISWTDEGNTVEYTLETNVELQNFWIAIGFSDDQLMGNDSVTGCKYSNDSTEIFNAKNPVHRTPDILDDEGVKLRNGKLNDGVFKCVFERVKNAGISIDRFDLYQPWYLLFAKGRLTDAGQLSSHSKYDAYNSSVKYDPSFRPTTPPPVTTTASPPATTSGAVTTVPTTPSHVTTSQPSATTPPPPVTTTASPPATTSGAVTTVPTTPSHVTTSQPSGPPVSKVKGCGRTVGCYSDCVDLSCSFIVSWHTEGVNAIYTIASTVAWKPSAWVAIGFSSDAFMGEDDVMGCASDTTGRVVPFTGWNSAYKSPAMYTDNEIKLTAQIVKDGSLSCTFRRPIARASSGTASRRVNVSEPWTMLFAKGPGSIMTQAQSVYGRLAAAEAFTGAEVASLRYHGKNRFVSTSKISANDRIDLGSIYDEYPLVKTHGSLMIAAWIFFSSIGILIPRYYRTLSKSKLFCGETWVNAHRMCMVFVLIITITGVICIYIQSKRYSYAITQKGFQVAHPIIGIVIMVLIILNPTIAILRPAPGAHTRPIFNWAHGIIGLTAQVLAVINIFFGVQMTKADVPYYLVYILAAYTCWEVAVAFVLEIVYWLRPKSYTALDDSTSQQTVPEGSAAPESTAALMAKLILFWLHFFVLLSVATSLIVLLVLGNRYLQD